MSYTLHCGDCMEYMKGMEAESIDLIFTDPVYDHIDDYRQLVEMATVVLKPGGNLVAFVSSVNQLEIGDMFAHALTWCDFLVLRETARRRYNYGRKIVGLYEVAAWASKGKDRLGKGVNNFSFVSNGYIKTDTYHDWEKPVKGIIHWIERLSYLTVFDPFMGSGTTGVACMQLGRNFVGCEIDKGYFEIAKKRIEEAAMQPRLFDTQEEVVQQAFPDVKP